MATIKNVAVISTGEMGLAFAQMLLAHHYRVVTYAADRSQMTQDNARDAGVELLPSIDAVADASDLVLSIVPPRDAYTTAQRFATALTRSDAPKRTGDLWYMDLNAVSPETARQTAELLSKVPGVNLIDGGIVGGTPRPLSSPSSAANGTSSTSNPSSETTSTTTNGTSQAPQWYCPSCIVSGPHPLPSAPLTNLLHIDHISPIIGAATGVKMCFGATTKGFVSLAIQSYTTAYHLGQLDVLRDYLSRYQPETFKLAEKGLTVMPPKAYRWVGEMREIGDTLEQEGGFGKELFYGVADVYSAVADDSLLGLEKPGKRVRGKTVEDVVEVLSDGMRAKRKKTEASS